MSEGKLLEALRLGWISIDELKGDEFIFYFVPGAEPPDGTWVPETLELIYDAARRKTPPRFVLDKGKVPSATDLAKLLDAHGFQSVTNSVLKIFDGLPWRLVADLYSQQIPDLRVLGPKDYWSGFDFRWEPGYANRGATL